MVRWRHAPPAYLQGNRTIYTVYYQNKIKTFTETQNKNKEFLEIILLKVNTEYAIWITASTTVGEGVPTTPIKCSTEESSE